MVKKKGIVSKLVLGLFVLTAISCCFLGSTFARYTSGGTGKATTGVAKWDVSLAEEDSMTKSFGELSPAQKEYDGEARTNSTGKILVAELTNKGEVDATVTFTASDTAEIALIEGGKSFGAGIASVAGDATEEEVQGLFTIELFYNWTNDAGNATAVTEEIPMGVGATMFVYAEVIWTSDDGESASDQGAAADKLDTWVGENVESVAFDISYTAVQASEHPGA